MKERKFFLASVTFAFILFVFVILIINKDTPEYQILKKHKDEISKIAKSYRVDLDYEKHYVNIYLASNMSYSLVDDMIKISKELYLDYLFNDESPFKEWEMHLFIYSYIDEDEESYQIIADKKEVIQVNIFTNIVNTRKVAEEFPDVSTLSIRNCKVTSEQLSSFSNIHKLCLMQGCMSEDEIDKFKELYPDCEIIVFDSY